MKILMLIDRLDVGGAESHLITLTRTLTERGHTVHVFAERGAWTKQAETAGATCHFPPLPLTGKSFFASALPDLCYLRRLISHGGYDVVHAHTRRTAFLLRLVGSRPFCARVVTCHAKFAPRYRRLCYWGEGTVAVSDDLKAHLTSAFSLSPERIRVIPNGIDTRHFSAEGHSALPHALRVTLASRLDEDCSKAARLTLSLCEAWSDRLAAKGIVLSVTLVGGGAAYPSLCREAASVNQRAGRELVRMTGTVDDPSSLLGETDLFVGVSRAALEALFCGASVLLAGDEGMAGLLTVANFDRLSKGNLCCRGESSLTREGLEAAFAAFLDMTPAERQNNSARLRAGAAELFGAARMGEQTEAIYRRLLAAKRPRRWLVAGYAGCGNLGDDAIARRLIDELRAQDPAASVSLTVSDPTHPRHRFSGATVVDRRSPSALLRAIRQSDALVLGGGCLLQNCSGHGGRSLSYYLLLAWLARLCRRPVLLVAAGIGPVRGWPARYAVGRTLRRAAYLSVRDSASRRLAVSLGVPSALIRREADPVLSLTPATKKEGEAFLTAHLHEEAHGKCYLCIAPRPGCVDEATFARALARLCRREGLYPLFLPFDRLEDTPVCKRLIQACGQGVCLPCEDERLVASLFSLDGVAGVASGRLHALILAHVGGKAALALSGDGRDGKVAGFARSVGGDTLGKAATAEDILAAFSSLINHRDG